MKSSARRDAGQGGTMPYQPALDGLRAAAVTMVLLFHGDVSWMRGGYFGVSVFFTLSGFLITSLLVREFAVTGRVTPSAFYARRAKRLLPASIVCLAAVSVLAAGDVWTGANHVRRDVWASMLQVANWVKLSSGESYTDLQSRAAGLRSPLDHYWSLAIEEQFYWIWPVAFWLIARVARRRGYSLTRVIGVVTMVFVAAAPAIAWRWGRDAAYWATPARAGEIMLGAWLAVALCERRVAPRRWMAPAGAATVALLAVVLPAAGGPAYHGAFPFLAVASACVVVGLQHPGAVTSALSWTPVVALGRISYGVYLYHFPIFVLASAERVHQTGVALLGMRIGITLAVATVSYWVIERPIRRATWTPARTASISAATLMAAGAVALVVPVATTEYWNHPSPVAAAVTIPPSDSVAPLVVQTVPSTAAETVLAPTTTTAPAPETTTTVPALSRPARILLVGDSTVIATNAGLVQWAAAHPELAQVSMVASPGCGFVRNGTVLTDNGVPYGPECDMVLDNKLPAALSTLHPDAVVLMSAIRDVMAHQWDAAQGPIAPPDENYMVHVRTDYTAITQMIIDDSTAEVVWVQPPSIDPWWLGRAIDLTDPIRHDAIEQVMHDLAAEHPDRVEVLDFRGWFETDSLALSHDARPDGIHFTVEAATDVSARWLGPQLVLAAERSAAGGG